MSDRSTRRNLHHAPGQESLDVAQNRKHPAKDAQKTRHKDWESDGNGGAEGAGDRRQCLEAATAESESAGKRGGRGARERENDREARTVPRV